MQETMLFCEFDLRKSQTERKASMIIIINCVTPHNFTHASCFDANTIWIPSGLYISRFEKACEKKQIVD